jgi:ornithine cyclodeaminase/alanine dehydrogenase-like protein (mu-crystallin family)
VEIHSFSGLAHNGELKEEQVNPLQDVVLGRTAGRENDDQLVFCCTLGMGAVDIAIADMLYHRALEKGLGQKLLLWDNPLWV